MKIVIIFFFYYSSSVRPKFRTKPIIIKQDIRKEPPYEIKGNGKPLTGIRPAVIEQLTKIWPKKILVMPMIISEENLSVAWKAIETIFISNQANRINIVSITIKPSSSPITLTIKSDSCTGKNFNWVWVPWPRPFPKSPPEPSAVLLWIIWYPAPSGSNSGLIELRILFFWYGLSKFQSNGKIRPKNTFEKNISIPFQSFSLKK